MLFFNYFILNSQEEFKSYSYKVHTRAETVTRNKDIFSID